MPAEAASSSRRKAILAASLVALPVIPFFAILFYFAINIPVLDDYDGGLDYLNHLTQLPGFWARFLYCITAQHNEYKTLFANAIVWIQVAIFGHIDFRLTCFLGNLFVLLIGVVLWKMFLPKREDLANRLLLFSPVIFMLFQLNYVQTLNWALPGLQNLAVVGFVIAAIHFLMQDSIASYYAGLASMVLAISSSTNGFFLVPIGVLILFNRRGFVRAGVLILIACLCLGIYLFHYTLMPSLRPEHHSLAVTVFRNLTFLLSFLGNALFLPKQASLGLGLIIVSCLGYITWRGYWRRNPTVGYCLLFVLLTAVTVTGIRSQTGLWEGTSSRYRIYCDLLMIFGWFFFAEECIQDDPESLRRNRPFMAVFTASLLFCVLMDAGGIFSLHKRNHDLIRGLALYQHPQPMQPPGPATPMPGQGPEYDRWSVHAREVLDRSIQLGIYRPPSY